MSTTLTDHIAALADRDDDEVLDAITGLQRAQARLAWAEFQAMVRLAGPYQRTHEVLVHDRRVGTERLVEVTDEVRDEIAAALHRSPGVVHDQITTARLLNGPLAATSHALRDGRITAAHVRVIVEQVRRLDGAVHCAHVDPRRDTPAQSRMRRAFVATCEALQQRVLPGAASQTPAQTRAHARRAVAALDAAGEQRRRERARCTRDVWVSPDDDGMATLVARLDALSAHAIRAAVDAAAADDAVAGDCGATLGERRAEALAALVLGRTQVVARIDLAVPVGSLGDVGSRGAIGEDAGGAGSAALPDGTLVGWDDARSLLDEASADIRLRRLLTDPVTGTAIDLGRSRYAVSEPLRRWITARDRTCRFPGCRRRAASCEVDHVEPWEDGGRTDAANLQALCPRHHQLKTHRGWRVARDPASGVSTWISPLGRRYEVDPEPVPVAAAGPPAEDPPPF